MIRSSCLCGDVSWEARGDMQFMMHCHCSRCRKAHGSAFATHVTTPAADYRLHGTDNVAQFRTNSGTARCFCKRCGSMVPGDAWQGLAIIPCGNLEADPGERPSCHIFVASKAAWYRIADELPRFDAYPESIDSAVLPDRDPLDPPGGIRGSCLCGGVTFVVDGEPTRAHNCHCGRCRRARSAAHASNLFVAASGVHFTRGEDLLAGYKVPEARRFTQVFCGICGGKLPRVDRANDYAAIPMGALDDDPGFPPQSHIFVGSKAPWFEIADDLPQFAEGPK